MNKYLLCNLFSLCFELLLLVLILFSSRFSQRSPNVSAHPWLSLNTPSLPSSFTTFMDLLWGFGLLYSVWNSTSIILSPTFSPSLLTMSLSRLSRHGSTTAVPIIWLFLILSIQVKTTEFHCVQWVTILLESSLLSLQLTHVFDSLILYWLENKLLAKDKKLKNIYLFFKGTII